MNYLYDSMSTGSADRFEIIIVGGGPIGIACGLEAQKADLSYCIIEKGCLVNLYGDRKSVV